MKHLKELLSLDEAVQGPGFFQEARSYSDSGEFTDEFYDIFTQITKMKKVMKHPKWLEYMKTTDRNFDTTTEVAARAAIQAVSTLEDALHSIDQEFDELNGSNNDKKADK